MKIADLFPVFKSISRYPSDVPAISFPGIISKHVRSSETKTFSSFLLAGVNELIDLFPRIRISRCSHHI